MPEVPEAETTERQWQDNCTTFFVEYRPGSGDYWRTSEDPDSFGVFSDSDKAFAWAQQLAEMYPDRVRVRRSEQSVMLIIRKEGEGNV